MASTQHFVLFSLLLCVAHSLTPRYYEDSCPNAPQMVHNMIADAFEEDPRIGASLLRLHFHDCFVKGCDASILLDESNEFKSEKDAAPNKDTLRGLDLVDNIKDAVEAACPFVVSCADILALAARSGVLLAGGPSWEVQLGRLDSKMAFHDEAQVSIPRPQASHISLEQSFSNVGLNRRDLITLSGAHTFGKIHCRIIASRLYNFNFTGKPDPSLDSTYLLSLRSLCPPDSGENLVNLNGCDSEPCDQPFNSQYYTNLLNRRGMLFSDQVLETGAYQDTRALIEMYSANSTFFFDEFANSMVKMGNIAPLTAPAGEVRSNCRIVNAV